MPIVPSIPEALSVSLACSDDGVLALEGSCALLSSAQ